MAIELFPGAEFTPELLLHRLLEKKDTIQGLVILVQNKDGFIDVTTTRMRTDTLTFASANLTAYITQLLSGEPPERTNVLPPKDNA